MIAIGLNLVINIGKDRQIKRLDAQISSIIWDIKGFMIAFTGLKTIDI